MSKFTILDDFYFSNDSNKINKNISFNPIQQIRNDVSNIFKDFILVKTNQFDDYSIYKAKVDCLLCVGGIRYIVAIVKNDNNIIGSHIPIQNLNWIVFQTRYTNKEDELKNINIPAKTYSVPKNTCLNDKIKKWIDINNTNRDKNLEPKVIYKPENLPLTVELLKMKDSDSFSDSGTVLSALELFQTILILED
jgi:hypothetical protein